MEKEQLVLAEPLIKIDIMQGNFDSALERLNNIYKYEDLEIKEKGKLMENIVFTFETKMKIDNKKISEENHNHFLVSIQKFFNLTEDIEAFEIAKENYENNLEVKTSDITKDVANLNILIQMEAPLRLKCKYLNKFITIASNEYNEYIKYKDSFDRAIIELKAYHEAIEKGTI